MSLKILLATVGANDANADIAKAMELATELDAASNRRAREGEARFSPSTHWRLAAT
ncbi:Hypothetical protein NGAL_HAMBI1146_27990 [Neorhizobium galegae bv. officinalis]|nr:Hypothetical protein NGAL_HAMBI490_34680 [Neorhizobium galegae bv. officinalis]CDZ38290.1 Hypothetical protein NGAL_HAMBI1146_27990 [Neorhizobium galegae bv. officinalis]